MQYELNEHQKIKVLNADDVARVMQEILIREDKIDQSKEHFWMIGLEANFRIRFLPHFDKMGMIGRIKSSHLNSDHMGHIRTARPFMAFPDAAILEIHFIFYLS